MNIKFTRHYKFAHGGTQIECFEPEQIVENPPARLYELAISDGAAIDPEAEETLPEESQKPAATVKPAKPTKVKA